MGGRNHGGYGTKSSDSVSTFRVPAGNCRVIHEDRYLELESGRHPFKRTVRLALVFRSSMTASPAGRGRCAVFGGKGAPGSLRRMNRDTRGRSRLGKTLPASGARGVRAGGGRKPNSPPDFGQPKPVDAKSDTISLRGGQRELNPPECGELLSSCR